MGEKMERQQIEAVVLKVLRTLLKCEVSAETSRENTPYWDSLKHIEVVFTIEDEFSLQFTEEELSCLDSVEHLVYFVLSRHET